MYINVGINSFFPGKGKLGLVRKIMKLNKISNLIKQGGITPFIQVKIFKISPLFLQLKDQKPIQIQDEDFLQNILQNQQISFPQIESNF